VAPSVSLPHNHPGYACAFDGLTEKRPGWTANNALFDQLGSLGYSPSQRTVDPPIVLARYSFVAPATTRRLP
jgi:hypothetical protein